MTKDPFENMKLLIALMIFLAIGLTINSMASYAALVHLNN